MQRLPPQADYIFRGHQDDVNCVRFFNSDKYIASCDAGGTVIVWLFQTRRPVFQWKAHTASCLCVHVYNQDKLVSQGRDDRIYVWHLDFATDQSPQVVYTLPYYSLNFCQLSLYQTKVDRTLICFPSKGDTPLVDIYDLTDQRWVVQSIGDQDNAKRRLCMTVQFLPCDNDDVVHLLVGYESGDAALWQCHLGSTETTLLWQAHLHDKPGKSTP
ncbi:hypothetical protein [Absidia glauca]|uniref:Uncharacterized protein n=1 Tax=Absidia glauca TaxID=4829 RepID=A0A168STR4_ABSGL|nr:hypothetical protein [Absidia glauca]